MKNLSEGDIDKETARILGALCPTPEAREAEILFQKNFAATAKKLAERGNLPSILRSSSTEI